MIYKNEFDTLALLKRLELIDNISYEELKQSFSIVSKEYQNLHRQMRNLIKVSDSSQNKLLKVQNLLLEQNNRIQKQNEQLNELNEEKDQLLSQLNAELKNAFEYLTSLIPKPFQSKFINTDWLLIPSAELGGDALGYYWIDDNNFVFYVLDVCGHGIGAALHSVQILNTLHYRTLPNIDFMKPDEVLSGLNSIFQMKDHNEMYFSLFYGIYNIENSSITYCSGGHPPAILFNYQNIININSQSSLIGVKKNAEFKNSIEYIDKSSDLYIFTDGVYEIRNDKLGFLKINGFKDLLVNQIHLENFSLNDLYSFSINYAENSSLNDDYTILKISFHQ